mmetsp:Transcript_37228/g.57132  ORF Transcript_37228/g.57132 Transcript_37228/m.57132 type:complete len:107 (-) Transcript_37228:56-376(-)
MSKLALKRNLGSTEGSPWHRVEKKNTRNPLPKGALGNSTLDNRHIMDLSPPKNLASSSSSSRASSSSRDHRGQFKIQPLVTPMMDGNIKTAGLQQPSKPSLKIKPL